jgi:hypothetical protein
VSSDFVKYSEGLRVLGFSTCVAIIGISLFTFNITPTTIFKTASRAGHATHAFGIYTSTTSLSIIRIPRCTVNITPSTSFETASRAGHATHAFNQNLFRNLLHYSCIQPDNLPK